MDNLSLPQARVLAAFSFGLGLSGRCTLSVVGRSLFSLGKPDTVERRLRRLQRFISNPRIKLGIKLADCCQQLSRWVISSLPAGKPLVLLLLVDETSLQDHLKAMVVSLAYRGKAIPLAWWCYRVLPTRPVAPGAGGLDPDPIGLGGPGGTGGAWGNGNVTVM